jgi:hypothetical protein
VLPGPDDFDELSVVPAVRLMAVVLQNCPGQVSRRTDDQHVIESPIHHCMRSERGCIRAEQGVVKLYYQRESEGARGRSGQKTVCS